VLYYLGHPRQVTTAPSRTVTKDPIYPVVKVYEEGEISEVAATVKVCNFLVGGDRQRGGDSLQSAKKKSGKGPISCEKKKGEKRKVRRRASPREEKVQEMGICGFRERASARKTVVTHQGKQSWEKADDKLRRRTTMGQEKEAKGRGSSPAKRRSNVFTREETDQPAAESGTPSKKGRIDEGHRLRMHQENRGAKKIWHFHRKRKTAGCSATAGSPKEGDSKKRGGQHFRSRAEKGLPKNKSLKGGRLGKKDGVTRAYQ